MDIRDIIPNEDNPRTIQEKNFKKLVKSIKEFPEMLALRPIVLDEANVILGGNMRYQACLEAGLTDIPVTIAKGLTEDQKKEFIIKDNVSGGDWDWSELMNSWDTDLLSDWGLDMPEGIGGEEAEETTGDDEVPEIVEDPETVMGDLWELGEHRLLCGDSTINTDLEKLIGTMKINLLFTSPPYNAGKSESLSGNTHSGDNKYDKYNDDQKGCDYLDLLKSFTNNYLWVSDVMVVNLQQLAGNKKEFIEYLSYYNSHISDIAIWNKGHSAPAMAENVMNSCFEYMIFLDPRENPSRAINGASFRGTVKNVLEIPPNRSNEFSKVHAATFPIDLPLWVLDNFTESNYIIGDSFAGTGTTLIACEKRSNISLNMELDPRYCDIIVKRYIKFCKENNKPYTVKLNGEEYKGDLLDA